MKADYRLWLQRQGYGSATISAQLHRVGRVETHYGDLDRHYAVDRLQAVVSDLRYSTDDERHGRPNPSKIPFEGDIRTNLVSYRTAVEWYCRFRAEAGGEADGASVAEVVERVAEIASASARLDEDVGQRIGLERDMQAALRQNIDQLEEGLRIEDGGAERSVESGFIDITARDASGALVVIELKAGAAGQRAVAQILSYMGDVQAGAPETAIRGVLVAASFDQKARAAARMVPSLSLVSYGVQFRFAAAD